MGGNPSDSAANERTDEQTQGGWKQSWETLKEKKKILWNKNPKEPHTHNLWKEEEEEEEDGDPYK